MNKKRSITIGDITLNDESDAFVIAEIGHNHQGDLEVCKRMFKAAKESGAHAVKLQKRDNKNLYTKEFYNSAYNSENAFGATYGAHRDFLEFGKKEYKELQRYAKKLDILFFATAFDMRSADFLKALNMPCYKMASGDITNLPLLKYVAQFKKPMIISTGGSSIGDIKRAYREVYPLNKEIAFLHCTAMYPISEEEEDRVNLKMIETLRREFPNIVVGFSDHSNGVLFSTAAYAYGARIIEKHFTLKRTMKGTDQPFSLEPVGMERLISYLKRLRIGTGDGHKHFYEEERGPIRKMAKMLVAARDLKVGETLTIKDIAYKSPADGLLPNRLGEVIGKTLTVPLKKDSPILIEYLSKNKK